MIETYHRINRFIPSYFNKRTEKEQLDILQDFANFLIKKFGISNNYTVKLSENIDTDIARLSIHDNSLYINKGVFIAYKKSLTDPKSFKRKDLKKLKTYSYDLCCAITHEMKHAEQYEKCKNGVIEYENYMYPVNNKMLYMFQPMEQEAFMFDIDEMHYLFNHFNSTNMLSEKELKQLKHFIWREKNGFLSEFKSERKQLEKAGILDRSISNINPYNYKAKLDTSRLDAFIGRELTFVKDRNDVALHASVYTDKDIHIAQFTSLNYKFRDDNGKWNVNLTLGKTNNMDDENNRRFKFVLSGDTCRINHILLDNGIPSSVTGDELLKYFSAFVSIYPNEIKHVQISDFAYNLDYEQTLEFIKTYTKESPDHKLAFKISNFTAADREKIANDILYDLTLNKSIKVAGKSNPSRVNDEMDVIR